MRRPTVRLLAMLVIAACSEAPTGPMPLAQTGSYTEPLRDPGIDQSDTYLAFSATMSTPSSMSFSTPLYNPTTGTYQTNYSIPSHSTTWYSEMGYDSEGRRRISVYNDAPNDLTGLTGHETEVIRLVGDSMYRYDAKGVLLAPGTANVPGQTLPALSFLHYNPTGPIPSSVVMDSPPPSAERAADSVAIQRTSSGGRGVERRYEAQGGKWLLTEISSEVPNDTVRIVVRLSDHRWNRNQSRDDERRRDGEGSDVAPAGPQTADC